MQTALGGGGPTPRLPFPAPPGAWADASGCVTASGEGHAWGRVACAEASLGLQQGQEPRRELRSESAERLGVQTLGRTLGLRGGPRGLSLRAEYCVKLCTLPANGQSEGVDGGAAHAYGGQ